MITNLKSSKSQNTKKNDVKIIVWLIVGFIIAAWLCTPPGNKFLQVCFWGNNTKFFIAKISGKHDKSYIFHRNNAVYIAKMFPEKKDAITQMDRAIASAPSYLSEKDMLRLYKDRAEIKLFLGEYKGALSDFMRSDDISFLENLKVAMLYKEVGNYREAMNYCNRIVNMDVTAYAGYACMAEIYLTINRPDVALRVWNLAIDRKQNNPRAYVDRAKVKKMLGDLDGYNQDINKAKEYSPTIDENKSIIYDTLHPKVLELKIN